MTQNEKADVTKELVEIYKRVNKKIEKDGELSNDEINDVIHDYRAKKKSYNL